MNLLTIPNTASSELELVETIDDIIDNMNRVDEYLNNGSNRDGLLDRFARGKRFVYRTIDGNKHFYPTKFIGYKNKDIDEYINNTLDDDGHAGATINKIEKLLKNINNGIKVGDAEGQTIQDEFKRFFNDPEKADKRIWDYDFSTYNQEYNNNNEY